MFQKNIRIFVERPRMHIIQEMIEQQSKRMIIKSSLSRFSYYIAEFHMDTKEILQDSTVYKRIR